MTTVVNLTPFMRSLPIGKIGLSCKSGFLEICFGGLLILVGISKSHAHIWYASLQGLFASGVTVRNLPEVLPPSPLLFFHIDRKDSKCPL